MRRTNARKPSARRRFRVLALTLILSGITLPSLFRTPVPSPLRLPQVEAQTCAPRGGVVIGPGGYYDWIANGLPTSTSCWSNSGSAVSDFTACGYTTKWWDFGQYGTYTGAIAQEFEIPNDMEHAAMTNFFIAYTLDFYDPYDDPWWNSFRMEVKDRTTNTILASESHFGDMGDLSCAGRLKVWTGNLAGRKIRVQFKGSRTSTNVRVRVRNIVLGQH